MTEMRPQGLRHNHRMPETSLTNKKMSESECTNVAHSTINEQSEWTKKLIELMMTKEKHILHTWVFF
jgi:hypothetical protein